ncbi:MAG TPA: exosortase family protein XrtF [Cyclobacteriaceae bacterium]|nr:exosortase family protein XrtF [Cyclobacteriaceae bacterium]
MQSQKAIILFLVKFIGLYIILNTIYGFWIDHYSPLPDPVTKVVTNQTVALISLTEDNVVVGEAVASPNVPIRQDGKTVVSVFEGCNSLNVMFVFLAFIVAFTGSAKKTVVFGVAGLVIIYMVNLIRVGLLFYIARYYPGNLYFFHKYLFTALLYVLVFILWYFWVTKIWPNKA